MSKCISPAGEYSEHSPSAQPYTCSYCGAFDEAAAVAVHEALVALAADLDRESGEHEVMAWLVASDIRDILDGHPERVAWNRKLAWLAARACRRLDAAAPKSGDSDD